MKIKYLNRIAIAAIAIGTLSFQACKDKTDDGGEDVKPVDEKTVVVTENITTNTTWDANHYWQLGDRITVTAGATLTIEAGTIIKGEAGAGANATALLVARGGKLIAEGKADKPIIFTTVADEITMDQVAAGNFASPNLDPNINGLWGGVILLGKAKISASNSSGDVSEVQIEGIPTSDPSGLYGGSDDADNSGSLKYISIRHGGTNIGAGNEINGLTLGGVGSGTVIENIEIVSNQDDAIEFFGGMVNPKNVVSWNVGDDGIDTDQSWGGTLDNVVVITPGDRSFELDGAEGSMERRHTIQNGSIICTLDGRASTDLANVDPNTIVTLKNLYYQNAGEGQIFNSVVETGVTFENICVDVAAADLSMHFKSGATIPAGITACSTKYADISGFGWTWAKAAGVLSTL
ncbi:MAG: hypothetical protein GC181_02720 [Bacteroidetes bacterium]|nr:hypothetical protein [Bacteroidota bacterium]